MTIKTLNIEELVKKKYITPSIDVCGLMEGVVMNGTSIKTEVDYEGSGEDYPPGYDPNNPLGGGASKSRFSSGGFYMGSKEYSD